MVIAGSYNPVILSFSYLYQIAHLGDNDDEPQFSSSMPLEEGETFFFKPRGLKNLVLVDEIESLSPVTHCKVCYVCTYVLLYLHLTELVSFSVASCNMLTHYLHEKAIYCTNPVLRDVAKYLTIYQK